MKRIWLIIIAVLVLSFLVDFLFLGGQKHSEFFWSHIFGFFALFGFAACILIIVISKCLGRYWLQRKEDYYDRDDDD